MVSFRIIDVCLPDYLTDHHNRPGELLLGTPVCGMTYASDVREGLYEAFTSLADPGVPDSISDLQVEEAISRPFDEAYEVGEYFDESLPSNEELGDGEWPQVWGLLEWDVPEEGGDESG